MSAIHMPNAKDVRELLEGLLGREVAVKSGAPLVDHQAPGGAMVGTYVDRRNVLRALATVDLAGAAHIGASLGLVPVFGADAAIEDGVLPDSLAENTGEVLNIMASLFNDDEATHLRLERTYAPGELLPPAVSQWVLAYVDRLNLDIDIKGYGTGTLCIISGF